MGDESHEPGNVSGVCNAASDRLRRLADAYDADALTYGQQMALDILVSDLSEAIDDLASVAAEVRDDT